MTDLWLGIDDATPPAESEYARLAAWGIRFQGIYYGGPNNGGRAWTPADAALSRAKGLMPLGIYVGENVCDGCVTPARFSPSQGKTDGVTACHDAAAFGQTAGPLALDVEAASTPDTGNGWDAYARAWCHAVAHGGYQPVLYLSPLGAGQYTPDTPTGLWLADWNGKADILGVPYPERWTGIAHQWSDNWHGFDANVADGTWWNVSLKNEGNMQSFPNGFEITGGIYQYWAHNGGVIAFGLPLSHAYNVNTGAHIVTRQWFERAILERVAASWPIEWDVTGVRLAAFLLTGDQRLSDYHGDVALFPSAFVAHH